MPVDDPDKSGFYPIIQPPVKPKASAMSNFFSQVLANVLKSPKTTITGILTIVGLFTPISPVVTAAAAGLTLILGAGDGHVDSDTKKPD